MSYLSINNRVSFYNDYPDNEFFASSRYRKKAVLSSIIENEDIYYDDEDPDVIIASKDNDYRLHEKDTIIIRDICDYHLDGFAKIDGWLDIVKNDDYFVFSTPKLELIYRDKHPDIFTVEKSFVVPDPFLAKLNKKIYKADSKVFSIGWFGNGFNANLVDWRRLRSEISKVASCNADIEFNFVICSDQRFFDSIESRFGSDSFSLSCIPYDPFMFFDFLDSLDAVVLPVDVHNDYTTGKSHNRLLEPLMRGVPVIAYGIPEYEKFSPFVLVNRRISACLQKIIDQPERVSLDLQRGQQFASKNFSPEMVGENWAGVIRLVGKKSWDGPKSPVRLNLGSGGVNLQGYINIDFVEYREGVQPDINCDIRKLPFPDNFADEILSVHVIEHFYLWELPKLLEEWRRVLKPGGKIALETPDLLEACRQILSNPDAVGGGADSQRTMWVLYGDPKHEEPAMCHRWLFSAQSLIATLEKHGFVGGCETVAHYKLGPPRDIRIEAFKDEME